MTKHMTEVAIDILQAVGTDGLTVEQVERLAGLMGVDRASMNCGGWWDLLLRQAGIAERFHFVSEDEDNRDMPARLRLTQWARDHLLLGEARERLGKV